MNAVQSTAGPNIAQEKDIKATHSHLASTVGAGYQFVDLHASQSRDPRLRLDANYVGYRSSANCGGHGVYASNGHGGYASHGEYGSCGSNGGYGGYGGYGANGVFLRQRRSSEAALEATLKAARWFRSGVEGDGGRGREAVEGTKVRVRVEGDGACGREAVEGTKVGMLCRTQMRCTGVRARSQQNSFRTQQKGYPVVQVHSQPFPASADIETARHPSS